MKFYNVNHQGKHRLERLSAHPADLSARIYYLTTDDLVYLSDGVNHYPLVKADGSAYDIIADEAKYS